MRLRFGLHHGTGVISKLIQWQQRSCVSHTSIIDATDTLIEAREFRGVVRERTLAQARADSPLTIVYLDVDREQYDAAMVFALKQLGKKYDYSSVARFVSRRQVNRNDNGKWFCSEYTFAVAQKAGVTLLNNVEPWAVSPGLFSYSPLLKVAE